VPVLDLAVLAQLAPAVLELLLLAQVPVKMLAQLMSPELAQAVAPAHYHLYCLQTVVPPCRCPGLQ
jgi:hypothetical protein